MKLSNIIALFMGGLAAIFVINLLKNYNQFNIWSFIAGCIIVYLTEIMKKSFRRYF